MQIKIGARLRQLRLEKGITQEQLAEAFGVSAQAVSRWENDTAYPDITLLPGLAIYFETSTDALMGMDELRNMQLVIKLHGDVNRLVMEGDTQGAVALIRDALRIYPDDAGLLMTLGETLAHVDAPVAREEAIRVEERVLWHGNVSMKARCTTAVNLIYLYMAAGRDDDAQKLVRELPHIWESRELMIPETARGAEREAALKAAVIKALVYVCDMINREAGGVPAHVQLGADLSPKSDAAAMLAEIGACLSGNK